MIKKNNMEQFIKYILLLTIVFYAHNVHATRIDQETWEKIQNRQFKIVDLNDIDVISPVTLQEIYGVPLNRENFNPGEEFLNFLRSSDDQIQTIQLSTHEFNDQHIHFHEFDHMTTATQESKKCKLVRIVGDPKTGKTSTLRWMYLNHIADSPENLAIFVNLPRIVDSLPIGHKLTLNDILRATVPAHIVGLIEDVANKNPNKMKIFIDGIGQRPSPQGSIESLIQDLYNKNMPIVTSGYPETFKRPSWSKIMSESDSEVVSIPCPMLPGELEDFTKQYWIEKLKKNYNLDATAVVKDYWNAFHIATQNIPLPQTIGTARVLADYVSNPNIDKPFIDLTEYATSSPSEKMRLLRGVITFSETHKFSKMKFYDEFFENSITPSQFRFYGKAALGILNNRLHLGHSDWMENFKIAKTLLGGNIVGSYPYLRLRSKSIEFSHEDFTNYFAAKYFMIYCATDNLISRFIKLMSRAQMMVLMQMINSELSTNLNQYNALKLRMQMLKPVFETLQFHRPKTTRKFIVEHALDNLITNGFDSLASLILETVLSPEEVMNYLEQNNILNSKLKYCFGILTNSQESSDIYVESFPRRIHTFSGTRAQMMAKFLMHKTMSVAKTAGFHWDPTYFLEGLATQSIDRASQEILIDYASFSEYPYPVEVLNKAMHEAVKALGVRSIDTIQELQHLGGVPSEVDVDGSTLAHVAVKWGSLELVKILHESFGVSFNDKPDNSGKTILFAALEASPFTAVTPGGFWPMMEYLIENGDFQCNIEMIHNNPPKSVPLKGIFPSYMTLLTSDKMPDIKNALPTFELVSINEMGMSASLRSVRRNVIIRSCVSEMYAMRTKLDYVTLTEILARYRGFDELSPADQLAYERTIIKSLELEASSLSAPQAKRVFTNIIRNMNADSELVRIWELYVKKVEPHLPPELSSLAHKIFSAWERGTIYRAVIKPDWTSLLLRTRYDLSSDINHDLPVTPNEYMSNFRRQLLISICDFLY